MKTVEDMKNAWFEKVLQNFFEKVNKTETCWLWTGGWHRSSGYGAFTVLRNHLTPHRFSWTYHKGEIPEGYWVLHKCDKRLCVNPDHLFIGDLKLNVVDMMLKQRQAKGENTGNCKLTEEIVKEIRASYIPYKVSCADLAKKYNCSTSVIFQIIQRQTWRHI